MSSKKPTEQPVQPEVPTQYGPAPQPHNTPYQDQPVNQQYFAQPQGAPVQYVVMAESLKGLKGWLMFFVIVFVLQAIGCIGIFFGSMDNLSSAANVVSLIFAPIIAAVSISSVVLISGGKKLGKWMAIATVGLATLHSIVANIISFNGPAAQSTYYAASVNRSVSGLVGGIVVSLLVAVLISLYFVNSRRVKETLVN